MAYHKSNYNNNLPAENERIFSTTGMSKETCPSPLSKAPQTKDSYWFAHGKTGDVSPAVNDPKSGGDTKDQQGQKDKEEKIRQFREMQEEERVKRMRELEQQFQQAKKHREQQEEERRRRIEEARIKELERRQQVEERKRQIWEAEQERKEAILRRNMEREARIEARRNAQRNSQSYVFGSSTPRTFDLDLAAIGMGRSMNAGSVLMSSVSRRSEERELGPPPRATSACSLDRKFENVSNDDFFHNDQPDYFRSSSLSPMPSRVSYLSKQIAMQHKSSNEMKACLSMWDSNVQSHPNFFDSPSTGWLVGSGVLVGEDCMSRSMVSLSSSTFRGRKRTDIMPTLTRERSITPHVTPRGNSYMRAVSMTRLDQLAQPRRTYRDPGSFAAGTTTNEGPRTVSPSMSKSMCNLANSSTVGKKAHTPMSSKGSMTRSMLHLADSPQKENRGLTPSPTMPKSGMRSAQSMLHLAVAPRLTRAARLRAEALAGNRTVSAWNLNKAENYQTSNYLSPAGKDTSRSPSRPQSSMSGTSELSTASSSAVNMRHRPAPRRPRPYSVHGSIVDSSSVSAHYTKKEPERPARLTERNTSAPKPERAKSANRESSEIKNTRPLTAPKKPIPPPKPVDVAAKAKPHPVPIKDNLRKRGKPPTKPATDENKVPIDKNEKSLASSEKNAEQEKVETSEVKDLPVTDTKPGSAVTSPTTDSDMMLVSSDDSKISAVMGSDMDTFSQSVTESDRYVQESIVASLSESQNASINVTNNESEVTEDKDNASQSIPNKAQQVELESETPTQSLQKDVKSESPSQTLQTEIPSQTQQIENPPLTQQKEAKPETPPVAQQKEVKAEIPSQAQQKEVKSEIPSQMQTSFSENMPVPSKPRITSEEEAKAALAEKRRLAREQAEREAELERQRLEEIRRQEEEQRRLEEEEQRRMEEEQIRLAELHRQIEQEKLAKAIEEQKRREKEEQEKKEEEARQKAEREEQERKAREEAERQRLELQEKLRKEEEERAERKRRVEQIMARTRGRAATTAQSPSNPPSDNSLKPAQNAESPSVNSSSSSEVSKVTSIITNGVKDLSLSKSTSLNGTSGNHISSFNSRSFSEAKQVSNNNPLPDILNSENIAKSNGTMVVTDEQSSKISVSNSFDLLSNRTLSANEDKSPQTNGYSSHEEMSCTTSPEENADVGLLIDIQSNQQRSYKSESADFTKLVDVEPTSLDNNVNNENYLINVDDVNSNLFNSGNPFVGFEDSLQKKQDTSVTDLLS
ncbi:MAP7 domain-containing protein 1-like isoform X2 [Argiope bruennichi]|uniref:MAP7 domain-containing protein 1-like isoform X2 n=1 Tax=Argiope bruennichi TaxID=94029 RepID=UPI0024940299|nr:MAP7 domain-containing protein 1-like isoform X2 [Argiope bruennichi]